MTIAEKLKHDVPLIEANHNAEIRMSNGVPCLDFSMSIPLLQDLTMLLEACGMPTYNDDDANAVLFEYDKQLAKEYTGGHEFWLRYNQCQYDITGKRIHYGQ